MVDEIEIAAKHGDYKAGETSLASPSSKHRNLIAGPTSALWELPPASQNAPCGSRNDKASRGEVVPSALREVDLSWEELIMTRPSRFTSEHSEAKP